MACREVAALSVETRRMVGTGLDFMIEKGAKQGSNSSVKFKGKKKQGAPNPCMQH